MIRLPTPCDRPHPDRDAPPGEIAASGHNQRNPPSALPRFPMPAAAGCCAVLWTLIAAAASAQAEAVRVGPVRFSGPVHEDNDLSAITRAGNLLLIASDEGSALQAMLPDSPDHTSYQAAATLITLLPGDVEIDLEGLAFDQGWVYAAGSHSLKRERLKPEEENTAWNRRRIQQLEFEDSRNGIFRLKIDPTTGRIASPIERINLYPILSRDPLLGRFCTIPGKENGIDIEGIAVTNGMVTIGFRSPVLRDNYLPVMRFPFDSPAQYELRFINLDGHGIRDIAAVSGGFLLLSGPPGDAPAPGRIYFWNGSDTIPGTDRSITPPILLGTIPLDHLEKPEALAVLQESPTAYLLLLLSDGMKNGSPTRYRINR